MSFMIVMPLALAGERFLSAHCPYILTHDICTIQRSCAEFLQIFKHRQEEMGLNCGMF